MLLSEITSRLKEKKQQQYSYN